MLEYSKKQRNKKTNGGSGGTGICIRYRIGDLKTCPGEMCVPGISPHLPGECSPGVPRRLAGCLPLGVGPRPPVLAPTPTLQQEGEAFLLRSLQALHNAAGRLPGNFSTWLLQTHYTELVTPPGRQLNPFAGNTDGQRDEDARGGDGSSCFCLEKKRFMEQR